MRWAVAVLIVAWLSGSRSLSSQASAPPSENSPRMNRGLHGSLMAENRNLFSPRMDYEEWTPLGRRDPLKNDPTYDYVPPVLERVHYWIDPSKRTPDPPLPNSGVLVLGSRTESAFATQSTSTQRYQAFQSKESQADSRIDTSSLLDPFIKLMDVSQFSLNFNSDANYKPGRIQRPGHQATKQRTPQPPQALQRPPYTMLVPPPPPPPPTPLPQSTNFMTTMRTQTTVAVHPTSDRTPANKHASTVDPTVLANTENVFKPVAISMPGHLEPGNETRPGGAPATASLSKKPSPETRKQQETHATSHVEHKPSSRLNIEANSIKKQTKVPAWHKEGGPRATTALPVTTARTDTLTTDPMFKHYKQPAEPIRGPFYLIIQGHSKVKTYGASKNPINRLLTSNEIKYDEEGAKKTRRLRYDYISKQSEANKVDEDVPEEAREIPLSRENYFDSLEDTFAKSDGGSSKKRYLGSNRRKRFLRPNRRLLGDPEDDCRAEGRNSTAPPDNLDLESLIAISDDYDPEDVAEILLRDEGGPGSGLGGFATSLLARTDKNPEDF